MFEVFVWDRDDKSREDLDCNWKREKDREGINLNIISLRRDIKDESDDLEGHKRNEMFPLIKLKPNLFQKAFVFYFCIFDRKLQWKFIDVILSYLSIWTTYH